MLYAVILAGGSGTRLWPESRQSLAKQFLSFETNRTMLESTVQRLSSLIPMERVWTLTGQPMIGLIEKSLPELPQDHILAEPAARNTAPCIGWAAVKLFRNDPEATMIVLPSDHVIQPDSVFCDTLRFAVDLVEELPERLVTLGVKPTFPSTSYGYIQRNRNSPLESVAAEKWKHLTTAFNVVRFHEKPPLEKALEFLKSGNFGWNAGIFVWKAKTILELLNRFEPEIGEYLNDIADAIGTDQEQIVTERIFPLMKKISIDFAVMERAETIIMLEAGFSWDDVGTWCSLDRLYAEQHDVAGNLAVGSKVLAIQSSNCIVRGNDPKHLFALLGMENVIVVQTQDATLIARKDCEESVREVIEELKKRNWNEYL
ncbi:MAG: mannose-1-phosphate guanyltransferase [Planctomycetaceae bacterium]|jgi:mannose-1-phosphate guanylyltransferase|nr:mannose-1-phosphate guanyltransferase [Planctomycetaceae bacterium]